MSWISVLKFSYLLFGLNRFSLHCCFFFPSTLGVLLKFVFCTTDCTLWNINYWPVAFIEAFSSVTAFLCSLHCLSFLCSFFILSWYLFLSAYFFFKVFSLLLQQAMCSMLLNLPEFIKIFFLQISWNLSLPHLFFFLFTHSQMRGSSPVTPCLLTVGIWRLPLGLLFKHLGANEVISWRFTARNQFCMYLCQLSSSFS